MEKCREVWSMCGMGEHREWVQGHLRQVSCALFTFDEKWVVSGSYDKKLSLWNFKTKSKIKDLDIFDDSITALHFFTNLSSPYLIVGLKSGKIIVNELKAEPFPFSTSPSFELKSHNSNITSIVTLSPIQIASSSWDCQICIWDLHDRILQRSIKTHKNWINSLIYSNNTLISCSNDKTIQFHQLSHQTPKTLKLFAKITSINISNKLKKLISGNNHGNVEIWDLNNLEKVFEVQPSPSSVECIQVNWDQIYCWVGFFDGVVVQVDVLFKGVRKKVQFGTGVNFVCLSKYSNFLILAGKNGSVGWVDWGIEDLLVRKFHGHVAVVHRAQWVEEGKIVFTADCLGNVALWDLIERRLIVKVDEISEFIMDLAFDPETFILAYSTSNNKIYFYSLLKLSKIADLNSPSEAAKFLYFSNYNILYMTLSSELTYLETKGRNFISMFCTDKSILSFAVRSIYIILTVTTDSFPEFYILKLKNLKITSDSLSLQ